MLCFICCFIYPVVITIDALLKGMNDMRLTQEVMLQTISLSHVSNIINPSDVCKSEKNTVYRNLLEALAISIIHQDMPDIEGITVEHNNWVFNWSGRQETDSYEPACAFIKLLVPGTKTVVVGNGEKCMEGLLFNEQVHALRSKEGAHGENVAHLFNIRGRPDVITVTQEQDLYLRNVVRYGIEIKTTKQMQSDSSYNQSLREAILHLIGLNVANTTCSPPLILTNLNKKHSVMFISKGNDPDIKLTYVLNIYSCESFAKAIKYVYTLLETHGTRSSVTTDFGRSMSPFATVRGSENEEMEVDNENINVEEHDPLDALIDNIPLNEDLNA